MILIGTGRILIQHQRTLLHVVSGSDFQRTLTVDTPELCHVRHLAPGFADEAEFDEQTTVIRSDGVYSVLDTSPNFSTLHVLRVGECESRRSG